ncbi:MAG: hypothetical protein WCI17_11520, partial [bacterium]
MDFHRCLQVSGIQPEKGSRLKAEGFGGKHVTRCCNETIGKPHDPCNALVLNLRRASARNPIFVASFVDKARDKDVTQVHRMLHRDDLIRTTEMSSCTGERGRA